MDAKTRPGSNQGGTSGGKPPWVRGTGGGKGYVPDEPLPIPTGDKPPRPPHR